MASTASSCPSAASSASAFRGPPEFAATAHPVFLSPPPPRESFSFLRHTRVDPGEDACSVCLGDYTGPVRMTGCLHLFCLQCILRWSAVDCKCPLCKEPFVIPKEHAATASGTFFFHPDSRNLTQNTNAAAVNDPGRAAQQRAEQAEQAEQWEEDDDEWEGEGNGGSGSGSGAGEGRRFGSGGGGGGDERSVRVDANASKRVVQHALGGSMGGSMGGAMGGFLSKSMGGLVGGSLGGSLGGSQKQQQQEEEEACGSGDGGDGDDGSVDAMCVDGVESGDWAEHTERTGHSQQVFGRHGGGEAGEGTGSRRGGNGRWIEARTVEAKDEAIENRAVGEGEECSEGGRQGRGATGGHATSVCAQSGNVTEAKRGNAKRGNTKEGHMNHSDLLAQIEREILAEERALERLRPNTDGAL